MSIHPEATEAEEGWRKGHSPKSILLPKQVGWGAG